KPAQKAPAGRHTPGRSGIVSGPPMAASSIATGTYKTKSRAAEEEALAEAQMMADLEAESGWYAGADLGPSYYDDGSGAAAFRRDAYGGQVYGRGGARGAGAASGQYGRHAQGGYEPSYDTGYNPAYTGGYDPYDAGYQSGYDTGYDPDYDASYNPGYTGGYQADGGFNSGFNAGRYSVGYASERGYSESGLAGTYSDDDPYANPYADPYMDGYDQGYAPEDDRWMANILTGKAAKRGLLDRVRDIAPTYTGPSMTLEDKYDAEAMARARANAVVDAYESGVPLGLAMAPSYDGYDYDGFDTEGEAPRGGAKGSGLATAAGAVAGAAASALSFGKGKNKGGVPTMGGGVGVQVQVPTARMEKGLNRSASAMHQKRLEAGTGSKASAMRSGAYVAAGIGDGGSRSRGAGRTKNAYGNDKEMRKNVRRRVIAIILILAIVGVVAAGGGAIGYFASLSNRLGLEDIEQVQTVLTEPEENTPYYVLFAADLCETDGSNDDLDAMLLARIDETNRLVTVIAIPGNVEVVLSDFDYHPATEARADGGNARLIMAISNLLDVDIAHFITTDAKGLATIVDALGGVPMTLSQDIDDPQAGWEYLPAGDYVLTGEQALTVLRADNFHEGETQRGTNRCEFGKQLMQKILGSGFLTFANITDIIAGNVSTDYTAREILKLAQTMYGLSVDDALSGVLPGDQETSQEGVRFFSPNYTELKEMMELMGAGVSPTVETQQGANVNPADVT
ncbi:MAG: LCP family protein, partial [Eggerthellaceae bacterium]|nr:LCP family protein [Eggerthellaceae bacterium]